jgi:hypothetical protein
MTQSDEPPTGKKSGNPSPPPDEPAPDDRTVDLTPFDFLTMRLRGPTDARSSETRPGAAE